MDREKVIRDLRYLKSFGRVSTNPQITEIAENAIALLKEQPQIVRCKDCKNNDGARCDNLDLWIENEPNWFCADGVKKDG